MRTVALINADLEYTPIGTRSRLCDELACKPVLVRTVERLLDCEKLDEVVICFPEQQKTDIEALVGNLRIQLRARNDCSPPYQALIRTARKWALDAWRGGLGSSCSFDEYTNGELCAAIANEFEADAIASVPPGAALLDPNLTDSMIEHADDNSQEVRLVFAQAPPGLVPLIMQRAICDDVAGSRTPIGWTLAYCPDEPRTDLAFKPCCFAVPHSVRHAAGRLCADTDRSFQTMSYLLAGGEGKTAQQIGEWLIERESTFHDTLPREVEIELTTEDPLPQTALRPRGERTPSRGPISLEIVDKIARELGTKDDSLVVLGGHGEPFLHPQFGQILETLRQHNVFGIAVYTSGQELPDAALEALIENKVDVVAVMIDAVTPETYARLHHGGSLNNVKETIKRMVDCRQKASQPNPVVIPHFTKCTENLEEMDSFFDFWMRSHGCATIKGYSHYCRYLPDLSVVDMTPPTRTACRRIMSRCTVLADGTVAGCDQDFLAYYPLGHLGNQTLEKTWTGEQASTLRELHASGSFSKLAHCGKCSEWHRP